MTQRKIQSEQLDLGAIGDVSGPASSTDNAIPRFDGIGGKTLQGSGVTISDVGNVTIPGDVYANYVQNPASGNNFLYLTNAVTGPYNDTALVSDANVLIQSTNNKVTLFGDDGVFVGSDEVVTKAATQTLTNKRITPRAILNVVSNQLVPDVTAADMYYQSLTANFEIAAPTGSPTNGQKLLLRFKDNGTARTLTWNAIYRAIGVTLPTSTVAGKTMYIGMVYNSTDTKWDVIAVSVEV